MKTKEDIPPILSLKEAKEILLSVKFTHSIQQLKVNKYLVLITIQEQDHVGNGFTKPNEEPTYFLAKGVLGKKLIDV